MGYLELQHEAQNLLQLYPVFLHSKTTGAGALSEVVEIAILNSGGTPLAEELVRPKRHIRPAATLEHGISDEMVRAAPDWLEVLPRVRTCLAGQQVCTYDPATEIQALKNSYENSRQRWDLDSAIFISLKDLCARYKNEWDARSASFRTFSLEEAVQLLGVEVELIGSRRAREDAWLMRALLLAIAGWKVR
jgi:DNA polymerase III epsilon subunit-like protein